MYCVDEVYITCMEILKLLFRHYYLKTKIASKSKTFSWSQETPQQDWGVAPGVRITPTMSQEENDLNSWENHQCQCAPAVEKLLCAAASALCHSVPCTQRPGRELGWQETADSSGEDKMCFLLWSERRMTHVEHAVLGKLHHVFKLLFSEETGNTDAEACSEVAFQCSLTISAQINPVTTAPSATACTETALGLKMLNSSSENVPQLRSWVKTLSTIRVHHILYECGQFCFPVRLPTRKTSRASPVLRCPYQTHSSSFSSALGPQNLLMETTHLTPFCLLLI